MLARDAGLACAVMMKDREKKGAVKFTVSVTHTDKQNDDHIDFDHTLCSLEVSDRLNVKSSRDFWIYTKTLVAGGMKKMVIDLSDISFIDSSGIGSLINTAKLLRKQGGNLAVVIVSDDIIKILDLVNFRNFIKVFENKRDALQYLHDN